ncbi:hypothetical protein ACHAPT_006473 [Fusarium lateritium]
MNFHLGAKNIELVQNRLLKARIPMRDEWIEVQLDLDNCIGNENGVLTWGAKNFSWAATDVSIELGPSNWAPTLYATLYDSNSHPRSSSINLAQCIGIDNGLLLLKCNSSRGL